MRESKCPMTPGGSDCFLPLHTDTTLPTFPLTDRKMIGLSRSPIPLRGKGSLDDE